MFGNFSIIDFFLASPAMLVLLACSIITVGYAIERLVYFRTTRIDARRFMQELRARIRDHDPRAALELCRARKAGLARVMEQALRYLHLEPGQLRERIATAIEVEQVEMERNLGVLGTMSNIAPLLGLFGTVVGIIRAFADIARTGAGGSSVVAMGVSEALMTTAAGIVIAVIATVFFNAFVRMIRTRIVEMEDARTELYAILRDVDQFTEFEVEERQVAVAGGGRQGVPIGSGRMTAPVPRAGAGRFGMPPAGGAAGQPPAPGPRRPGGQAAARVIDFERGGSGQRRSGR